MLKQGELLSKGMKNMSKISEVGLVKLQEDINIVHLKLQWKSLTFVSKFLQMQLTKNDKKIIMIFDLIEL